MLIVVLMAREKAKCQKVKDDWQNPSQEKKDLIRGRSLETDSMVPKTG